jgi:hypothetical protein
MVERQSRQVAAETVTRAAQSASSFTIRTYFFDLVKFSSMLVNSMGKMNFVAGLVPISFKVSKYCSVMVF